MPIGLQGFQKGHGLINGGHTGHKVSPENLIKMRTAHLLAVKGGSHDISNIQPLCRSCNTRKYVKTIDYRFPVEPNYLLK